MQIDQGKKCKFLNIITYISCTQNKSKKLKMSDLLQQASKEQPKGGMGKFECRRG
jgi:hypothetical protein